MTEVKHNTATKYQSMGAFHSRKIVSLLSSLLRIDRVARVKATEIHQYLLMSKAHPSIHCMRKEEPTILAGMFFVLIGQKL